MFLELRCNVICAAPRKEPSAHERSTWLLSPIVPSLLQLQHRWQESWDARAARLLGRLDCCRRRHHSDCCTAASVLSMQDWRCLSLATLDPGRVNWRVRLSVSPLLRIIPGSRHGSIKRSLIHLIQMRQSTLPIPVCDDHDKPWPALLAHGLPPVQHFTEQLSRPCCFCFH